MDEEFEKKLEEAEERFTRVLDAEKPEKVVKHRRKSSRLNNIETPEFDIEKTREELDRLIDRIQE